MGKKEKNDKYIKILRDFCGKGIKCVLNKVLKKYTKLLKRVKLEIKKVKKQNTDAFYTKKLVVNK
jgi:hypothetical protein